MKLLNYANRNLTLFLFLLMGIWGMFFYYSIIEEVIDETDDRLKNSREILVGRALMNPEILSLNDTIMQMYTFRRIATEEAVACEEKFYDSTIYIESEGEWEPVRVMKSCFRALDDNYYELEIKISTLERDDLIRAIFLYLFSLYLLLLVLIIVGNYFLLEKTFKPLQKLLIWLDQVNLGKKLPPLENDTRITEFRKLNQAAWEMSLRGEQVYEEQKQFIENASHELQTPLAISLNKLELLAEGELLSENQMNELDEIYQTIQRAVKLNKSLLVLSRISNNQYQEKKKIIVNELVKKIIAELNDIFEYKKVRFSIQEEGDCILEMNDTLAYILFTNLIKNALSHNEKQGAVEVLITVDSFQISNSGKISLDTQIMYRRFHKQNNNSCESMGLGLSIVKSIVDSYQFHISYQFKNKHIFLLKFVK